MTITVQALQKDGTWGVRSAFTTENAKVRAGSMAAADLEALARATMSKWQQTSCDGKQLRVHNSDNDPKPAARKPFDISSDNLPSDDARDAAYTAELLNRFRTGQFLTETDKREARAILARSKGGNVRGITEDHRFELADALHATPAA